MKTLFLGGVTCLIWSSVWLFIKLGLRDLPPVNFAAIRLVVAIAVFLPILAIRRSPLPRDARDWYVIGVAGLLILGVNYALLYWGAQFIPSGLTAVLQAVTPAFALVFGHFLLDDEPFTFKGARRDRRRRRRRRAHLVGSIAPVGASGAARLRRGDDRLGLRRLCLRLRQGARRPAAAAGSPHLRADALRGGTDARVRDCSRGQPAGPALDAPCDRCLLYLALAGSVAATWLNYWLLERMSATALLSMALVEPLIAVLLGAALLHERVTPGAAAGGVLVLCSIFMITISFRRSRT